MKYVLTMLFLMFSGCAKAADPSVVYPIGAAAQTQCCTGGVQCTKFPIYDGGVLTHQCFTPTDSPNSCYVCTAVGQ